MDSLLFNLLKISIVLFIVVVGRYVVPYLKVKYQDSKLVSLIKRIEIQVKSAEQKYKNGDEEVVRVGKKQWVINTLTKFCASKIKFVSDEQLSDLIESVVNTLFGKTTKEYINTEIEETLDIAKENIINGIENLLENKKSKK